MPTILRNHYVLAVHNVRESARFYVDALGFEITDEPQGWIFVAKDDCMIMLGECPNDIHPSQLGCHNYFAYLRVDDADACFARLKEKGVETLAEISDKPWGMREFGIKTSDGHRIMIGQKIAKPLEPLVFRQSVLLNASAARVWRAIVTPEEVMKYYLCALETIELHPGGRIIYAMGGKQLVTGTVMEVEPERRLVHTFRFNTDTHAGTGNDGESRVTYELIPRGNGCELTVTHDNFGADNQTCTNITGGWPVILGGLKKHVESSPTFSTRITATLSVRNWDAAVEFYKKAFGATELFAVPGGGVGQLSIGGADFWVAEESKEHLNFSPETLGGCSVRMLLMVEDPAKVCDQAVAAGAKLVVPVADNHGWRIGRIVDPFGHHWEVACQL